MKRKELFNNKWWVVGLILLVTSISELLSAIPEELTSYKLFFFTVNAYTWGSLQFMFWVASFKISLILILLFWFLSCRHWWRFVIVVPLVIECFKLKEVFNFSAESQDETNYITSLPLTLPIIVILIVILRRDLLLRRYQEIQKEVDSEIDNILLNGFNHQDIEQLKLQFLKLESEKTTLTKKDYLAALQMLKLNLESLKYKA